MAQNLATIGTFNGHVNGITNGEEAEEHFEVSEHVDWALGCLLEATRDEDTTVRWSAAKGIGRICSRLPKELASQGFLHHLLKNTRFQWLTQF